MRASWRETIATRIERSNLLANFTILMLCLVYILPNIWGVRTLYYAAVLPLFLLSVGKQAVAELVRAPIFLVAALYFVTFVVAAPFTPTFEPGAVLDHIRHSLLILPFLLVVAGLTRADRDFPFRLFTWLSVVAAGAAVLNIWVHYGGFPSLGPGMSRLGGVTGQTMYYNSNFVALSYGFPCIGAAAAIRPETSRPVAALLAACALVLLAAVVLTQTRGVLIGVAAGLAILIVLLPRQFGVTARRVTWLVAGLATVAFTLEFGASLTARSDGYRLLLWRSFLDYVEVHPWAGWGLTARLPVAADGSEHIHPHNMIYNALLHGGVFAAAALTALFVLVIAAAVRDWRRTGSPFLLAIVVAALVPLQMDFNFLAGSVGLDWVTLWLPVGLALGTSVAGARRDETATPVAAG